MPAKATRPAGAHPARAAAAAPCRHGKLVLLGFAVVFAVSVAGIAQIQINDNPVRWFKADHRIRVADQVLNEHFAGTYDALLVLDHAQPAGWRAAAATGVRDAGQGPGRGERVLARNCRRRRTRPWTASG